MLTTDVEFRASLKRIGRSVVRLLSDLWWSMRNGELHIGWYWKKCERYEKSGYAYTYFDGPRSSFWFGPLAVSWMGDSFEQDTFRSKGVTRADGEAQ